MCEKGLMLYKVHCRLSRFLLHQFLSVSSAFQKKEEINAFLLQWWHFSPLHSLSEKQSFDTFTKVWEGGLAIHCNWKGCSANVHSCEESPLKRAAWSFHYILIKDLKYHSVLSIACQHDQTHVITFRPIFTRCNLSLEHWNRSVIMTIHPKDLLIMLTPAQFAGNRQSSKTSLPQFFPLTRPVPRLPQRICGTRNARISGHLDK